jgi:hypothetical protein
VRVEEDALVGESRPHPVAPLHLVRIRAGLACQHAGVGSETDHLIAQPAVLELVEQLLCGGDEHPGLDGRLGVDGGRQLRWAEIRVDDPVDVTAELQPQPQITPGGGLGRFGVSIRLDHALRAYGLSECRAPRNL